MGSIQRRQEIGRRTKSPVKSNLFLNLIVPFFFFGVINSVKEVEEDAEVSVIVSNIFRRSLIIEGKIECFINYYGVNKEGNKE